MPASSGRVSASQRSRANGARSGAVISGLGGSAEPVLSQLQRRSTAVEVAWFQSLRRGNVYRLSALLRGEVAGGSHLKCAAAQLLQGWMQRRGNEPWDFCVTAKAYGPRSAGISRVFPVLHRSYMGLLDLVHLSPVAFPQSAENPISLPRPVDHSLLLVFSLSITLLISFGESSLRP